MSSPGTQPTSVTPLQCLTALLPRPPPHAALAPPLGTGTWPAGPSHGLGGRQGCHVHADPLHQAVSCLSPSPPRPGPDTKSFQDPPPFCSSPHSQPSPRQPHVGARRTLPLTPASTSAPERPSDTSTPPLSASPPSIYQPDPPAPPTWPPGCYSHSPQSCRSHIA